MTLSTADEVVTTADLQGSKGICTYFWPQYLNMGKHQLPNYATFKLSTIYPGLLTGSGMVHETNNQGELKLGFFFDHTSGLPMLPGS